METRLDVAYETWSLPGLPYTLKYSSAVFHEIDFLVNEGYRCIPYGGIEHAGLLLGSAGQGIVQIEAFRPIESEHSTGPSFALSATDIEKLQAQLSSVKNEPELSGLLPVGLFVSHSRRDLTVTAHEEDLLSLLFPEPWQLMLLIKPEKFKPTQFSPAFRSENALAGNDLAARSFILPLPGRSARKRRAVTDEIAPPPVAAPQVDEPPPAVSSKRKRIKRLLEESESTEVEPATSAPAIQAVPQPVNDKPAEAEVPVEAEEALPHNHLPQIIAATLMGLSLCICAVFFYWNHLQAPLTLHAAPTPGHLAITWQPNETNGADEAQLAISSNRGLRTNTLSASEKRTGQTVIAVSETDITVELVVHHALHTRRGAVRVIAKP